MNVKATTANTAHACTCGCGLPITTKALYKPGHDARHVSVLVAELFNTIQDGGNVTKQMIASSAKALPSAPLQAKFFRAADRLVAKQTEAAQTKVEAAK